MKTIMIPIEKLIANRVQPARRTNEAQLQDLVESIREYGQRTAVNVRPAGDGYVVLNGHRRIAALLALKKTHVLCNVVERSGISDGVAFIIDNTHMRNVSSGQVFTSWGMERPEHRPAMMAVMRPVVRSHIGLMCSVLGVARAEELARQGVSPAVAKIAQTAHNDLVRILEGRHPVPSLKQLTEWVISHRGAQADLSHAFRTVANNSKVMWRRLACAVLKNLPFPRSEWIPSRKAS